MTPRIRRRRRFRPLAVIALLLLTGGCVDRSTKVEWRNDTSETLVISAGNRNGVYDQFGQALAGVIADEHGVSAQVVASGGSIENLENLAGGRADLAFSAVDAAADAVAGRGAFSEPLEIRALARIYDDFAHLVVREDSAIRTVEDLRGRTVSIGAPDSGTALIARRLLVVAGITESEYGSLSLSLDQSIQSLRNDEIDAFFWSGGLRTPALTDLAGQVPFRLVPLGDLVEGVRAAYGSGYRPGTVPQGTYGLSERVATLAVPNVLVVRADLPAPTAHALVDTLFRARAEIAESAPSAAVLDSSTAIFAEPVVLHPGALAYYRATKE